MGISELLILVFQGSLYGLAYTPRVNLEKLFRCIIIDYRGILYPLDQTAPDLKVQRCDQGQPQARQTRGENRERMMRRLSPRIRAYSLMICSYET